MTYLDLIRNADRKLDKGDITLGEYEKMIEPLNREIDHVAESSKKVERTDESAQNVQNGDLIQRKAAIETLARMMPRSYTPDGSHPADEEIFRVQEVFADCIEALEILPSVQPEIIRCKDCKYWRERKYAKETKRYIPFCGFSAIYTQADDYCSKAERR